MSSSLVPRVLVCSSSSALGLLSRSSEPVTRSLSVSATRLLCSHSQEGPIAHAPPQSSFHDQTNPITQQQQLEDDAEDDEDGGRHVNKETGEVGGPEGPEPTRYGDWERNGRCFDF